MSAVTRLGRNPALLALPFPPSSLHHFTLSLHPAPPACILRRPAPPPPRTGRAIFSSYPLPSCSASPFLLHKLPKRESGADVVPSQPVQLSCPTIACGAQLAAPLPPGGPLVLHRFSLSPISRCGLSTSSEAIGKQRPKMRFPVSLPSLTNK